MERKFAIASEPEITTRFTLRYDDNGDVSLLANGFCILFISKEDGDINRYRLSPDAQKCVGLRIDGDNCCVAAN